MSSFQPSRHEEYVPDQEPLATWWRQLSPGTYYWRCKVPAKALPGQVLMFYTTDLVEDEEWGGVFPRQKGTAIWQFAGNTSKGILMAAMKEQGVRVLMEVDDNYITGPDVMGSGWARTIAERTDKHTYEAHTKLCKWMDGIIVSTPNLEAWYSTLNKNVYLCPNSVDVDDWPHYEKPNDGILRIGWGASHSHVVDAPLVRRALMWAADQPNVEVYVFGIGDIYKFPGSVKRVLWTDDQEEYRRNLAICDVHICPLIETAWSAGKSDVKALEASMSEAWPIVSSAPPYKPWHDRTMVCETAKDWENAIKWTVRHRDEIPQLAKEARDYVMGERLIEHSIHLWKEAVAG